jgi:outer membrane lipoprotein
MRTISIPARNGVYLAGLLLGACATHIPPDIREAPPGNPGLELVRSDPAGHLSQRARWGGTIIETDNRTDTTWLTVLALPLRKNGEPISGEASSGRFIAIVPGFLDPSLYTNKRQITVTGTLLPVETRNVGEYPYQYPVVQVESHYLWPLPQPHYPYAGYPYWWHDPWYYPWYPYRWYRRPYYY